MEGSGTFMSSTSCQGIEIGVEQGRVLTTLDTIKHYKRHI